jgi:hypothetical protein
MKIRYVLPLLLFATIVVQTGPVQSPFYRADRVTSFNVRTGAVKFLSTDVPVGGSGALDCVTSAVCDIVTAVVPFKASANNFTGLDKFSHLQVTVYTVDALPACNASFEGQMEGVSDAAAPTYLGTVTGGGNVHAAVYCDGKNWISH